MPAAISETRVAEECLYHNVIQIGRSHQTNAHSAGPDILGVIL